MHEFITASLVLATAAWSPSTLHAQGVFDSVPSADGFCHVWQMPPGGSNFPGDASYQRCALDRPPVLRDLPVMPAPRVDMSAGGSFLVVVNPDGAVNPDLTRAYTSGVDSAFHRQALESIRRWRFNPGIRSGRAVRSAFPIQLTSDQRNDTLPSRLEWRYVHGGDQDTLAGRWIAESPLPPPAEEQVDSIHTALLRHLVRMQVIVPGADRSYCIVPPGKDSAAQEHATNLASRAVPALMPVRALAGLGCARIPGTLRIAMPQVYRTEGSRAVLYPSGDYLPNWPAGFEGRAWRFWRGRCVAELPARPRAGVAMFCGIMPAYTHDEITASVEERKRARQWPPVEYAQGDSLRVAVFVTTGGAYLTDTLRTVVSQLARLDGRAVRDSLPPCGGWAAYSLQDVAELYVIKGDLTSSSLDITRVKTGTPPVKPAGELRCGPQRPVAANFAAFLLGGIGDRAKAPITLCFSRCARSYVLDPARHTLAERAQITFRFADLRTDTRMGNYLRLRIVAEPAPTTLTPLVIVSSGSRRASSAWIARRVGANAWDYGVHDGGEYPLDTEVHIYLTAR